MFFPRYLTGGLIAETLMLTTELAKSSAFSRESFKFFATSLAVGSLAKSSVGKAASPATLVSLNPAAWIASKYSFKEGEPLKLALDPILIPLQQGPFC